MKYLKLMLIGLFLLLPISIFSQTGDVNTQFDLMSLFTSFAGYSAGIILLTGLITQYLLKNLSKIGRSIASWVVAAIVGFAGYFLNLGIFADMEWYGVLVAVISFAAGSNVLYNVDWIRNLIALFKLVPKKSNG